MENSKLIDIYQSANENQEKLFKKNINSTLHVKQESEKIIKDTEWIEIMERTIPYIDNILQNIPQEIVHIIKDERIRKKEDIER